MWQAIKGDLTDLVHTATEKDEVGHNVATVDCVGEAPGNKEIDGSEEEVQTAVKGVSPSIDDDADENNVNEEESNDDEENNESSQDDERGMLYNLGVDFNDILFNNDVEDEVETTPEIEAARRCELVETFTEPLVGLLEESEIEGGDEGDEAKTASAANESTGVDENSGSDSSNDISREEELIDEEEDAIERKEVQQFLHAFDVEAHTQEISQLLSTEDDTTLTPLQEHFQTLVPQTVSYRDFWARYYYRCDPTRIARQWERQEHFDNLRQLKQQERRERAIKEVSDAAMSIGKSAASFLKGGWSGAAEAITAAGDLVEETATSLRVHQSQGRPPFVMSAVEDDDDSYYEEEEDEEVGEDEGGLGWSSDEQADEEEDDVCDVTEEVNFLEVSLTEDGQPLKLESLDVVRLRQSLVDAEGERNRLMQMVEERNEEMFRLRTALEQQQPTVSAPDSSEVGDGSNSSRGRIHEMKREAEWLKHLLAATAKISDDCRDESMNALRSILDQMKNEALEATIQDLQSKIQAIKSHKQMRQKLDSLRNETSKTDRCIAECQLQLRQLHEQQQAQADEHAKQLEQVVLQLEEPTASTPSTPESSTSSGVKVEVADGWGDEDLEGI